jgi:hypothetical protein
MGLDGCRDAEAGKRSIRKIVRLPSLLIAVGANHKAAWNLQNCLEGKATCLRKLVGLSLFLCYHLLLWDPKYLFMLSQAKILVTALQQ